MTTDAKKLFFPLAENKSVRKGLNIFFKTTKVMLLKLGYHVMWVKIVL